MHSITGNDNSRLSHVFILDNDAAVRGALTKLLEMAGHDVVAFSNACDFLDACTPVSSGCLILPVKINDMDGLDLQHELTRRGILLPIIFLSEHGTIPLAVRALKAGAIDFLTKPVNGAELLLSVKQALNKNSQFHKRAHELRVMAARLLPLTMREEEIMLQVADGFTSKEIGVHVGISFRTVENYRRNIMQKTACSNIFDLARLAEYSTSVRKMATC